MARWLWLAVLGFASCATLRPECERHGGTPWRELQTVHFTVRTNLDAEEGREAALSFERALGALRQAFPGEREPTGRIDAVVFRSNPQLQDIAENPGIVGLMQEDWHGHLVAAGSASSLTGAYAKGGVVMHELTHYVASYALARQPRWFAEGLADYFEGLQLDGGHARAGDANADALGLLQITAPLPFDSLWEWDSPFSTDDRLTALRYATSWLFVHYFYNRRFEQLTRYFAALANDEPPRAAFGRAFDGVDGSTLDREVRAYLNGGEYEAFIYELKPVDTQVQERPVPDAAVHAMLVRLAHTPERKRRELDAALAIDPSAPSALTIQALDEERAEVQLSLAQRLTTLHPKKVAGWRLLARALKRSGRSVAESMAALRQARSLAPADAYVLEELGADLLLDGSVSEAVAVLHEAVSLAPGSLLATARLARALALSNQCADAKQALERAQELGASHEGRAGAAKLLQHARQAIIECSPR